MRDINIIVYPNHTIDFENGYAGLNKENLQGNITFNFKDFVDGEARAEIIINNEEGYILLDKVGETYTMPIKSSLLTGDSILMQLVIEETSKTTYTEYDGELDPNQTYYIKNGDSYEVYVPTRTIMEQTYYTAETPIWKSETFFLKVGYSINATNTIPDEYPSWTTTLNNLIDNTETAIRQAENLNITSEQLDDGVKVITTDKNGEQTITIVPQGPQGEPGVPGAVKFIIVQTLPTEDIQTDAIYLVPSDEPTTQDLYLEYMYINNQWELLGQKQIVVDLTDYVQFTDYANSQKGGVIKVASAFGYSISNYNNGIYPLVRTYAQYQSDLNETFIGKGTLENVLTARIGDINTAIDSINGEVI